MIYFRDYVLLLCGVSLVLILARVLKCLCITVWRLSVQINVSANITCLKHKVLHLIYLGN